MRTYFFQLGHCPAFSHAEILAVGDKSPGRLHSIKRKNDIIFFDSDSENHLFDLFNRLGGSIRIGKILADFEISEQDFSAEQLLNLLLKSNVVSFLTEGDQRALFGLSFIGKIPPQSQQKIHDLLQETALGVKNLLRENGFSCRFILPDASDKRYELNSAQIDKNNLLDKGNEIVFLFNSITSLSIGITQRVQPYETFSVRDYGRPGRDPRSGMLPPKLARMMVNIACTAETKTLIDPFCGSGSILMEAGIAGLDAVGFDNNDKAVNDSQQNWEWMKNHYPDLPGRVRVFKGDVRSLHKLCEPLFFDTCVTEPYLGPPFSRPITKEKFDHLSKQLIELYSRALAEIRCVVKPHRRIVFLVPRFRVKDSSQPQLLRLMGELKLLGYKILDPFNGFSPVDGRTSLIYERPKQVVLREAFILET